MSRWKKFMAAALALSMTVPSCLPQTLWAAEFSTESTAEAAEDYVEGNGNAAGGSSTEEIPGDTVSDNTSDNTGLEEDDTFGAGDEVVFDDSDTAESSDTEDITEENDGLDLSDVPEMALEEQQAENDNYVINLYSNGKLEKTYTISQADATSAKAPAALKRSGYTFKEWNTRSDGKGTAYKPGASIAKLLESTSAAQTQSAEAAEPADISEGESADADHADGAEVQSETGTDEQTGILTEAQGQVPEVSGETEEARETVPEATVQDIAADTEETEASEENFQEPDQQTETADDIDAGSAAVAGTEDSGKTVNLYAIWTKNAVYKITYKLNGGKNSTSNPKTYTVESQIKLKSPTRSGYHFIGWYKDSKYKTKITTIKKGSKGSLTLYARWTPQVNASSKAATLTSVRGLRTKTIAATATVPKYVKSYDSYYYLVYVDSNTGKVKKAAAKTAKPEATNRKITLKVDISRNPEYAQGKFAIAVRKSKTAWTLISSKSYVSSPEKLASNQKAYFLPKTKKGIQSTSISQVKDTSSKTAFVNIFASDVMGGGEAYTYNGKKYYFGGMYWLRSFVSQCNAKGIQVTAQISLNKSYNTQSLITGSAYSDTVYYGWNTSKNSSRQTMEAMFAYLGTIFGDNSCYVSNWILGNEINSASHYYCLGNVSFSRYISMYSEAFRCLYNAVRSSRASSKVFICLDNCWRQKNIFKVCYTSKSTLDTFASTVSKLQKGINWNLAYHAYSQPLTEAQFWSSVNAPLLTNDANTATFITMHNIQALTNYVKNKFGSKTRIILSEQGYSSSYGGQDNQAASMALAYYKAACNPMIDAFIIRSYQDEAHEVAQGLAIGLKDAKGKKKTVFNVFKNMDSTSSLKYTGKVLNSKVGNWQSKVPGYSAKRVAGMYRVQ